LSKPTFNPNSWTGRLSAEEKADSDNNPFKPMIDKTVKAYFPGSTFKLVSAMAALNEGYIRPHETLRCQGFYEFGGRRFHCWNRAGHGIINLTDSLKHSCDVYYYKLGEKLGMDTLAKYAYMVGFGDRTGIGFNDEQRGLVPTKDWHRKYGSEGFQHGLTLSTSVGQGDTRVTPLQTAMAFAALANRGLLYYPRFIDRIETPEGTQLFKYPKRVRNKIEVPQHLMDDIDVGMTAVVNERGGTAFNHRLPYTTIAGKTGTAQVRGLDKMKLGVDGSVILKHRDHSWFVAYGPAETPSIVVVVFVQHGGSGGKVAAPVAMKIIDRYFREVHGMGPEDPNKPVAQSPLGLQRLERPQGDSPPDWQRPGRDDAPTDAASGIISDVVEPRKSLSRPEGGE
jgi:penicillin-binding protein 2